jgi:hypothetical protein
MNSAGSSYKLRFFLKKINALGEAATKGFFNKLRFFLNEMCYGKPLQKVFLL